MDNQDQMNSSSSNNNKKRIASYIILALLLIISGTLLYLNYKKSEKIEKLKSTIESNEKKIEKKTDELKSLMAKYQKVKKERKKLGLSNEKLQKKINNLKQTIDQVKKQKQLSDQKIRELNSKISDMKDDIREKNEEIKRLIAQNDSLSEDVEELTKEKGQLGDSLSAVSSKKEKLKSDLEYASILETQHFEVKAFKDNGSELTPGNIFGKEGINASRISEMKFSFTLSDNKAAQKGKKVFYLRIIPPSGEVYKDPINGGKMKSYQGKEMVYSMSDSINFKNKNEKVNFNIVKGFNYVPGMYTVELYNKGYKIGEGEFKLR